MASTYADVTEESREQQLHHNHGHHHHHQQAQSPRDLKRTWSTNSSGCGQATGNAAVPRCVCAPATHARSFKCRLHRTNSQGHSAAPSTAPQPPVSASATRTVEAL